MQANRNVNKHQHIRVYPYGRRTKNVFFLLKFSIPTFRCSNIIIRGPTQLLECSTLSAKQTYFARHIIFFAVVNSLSNTLTRARRDSHDSSASIRKCFNDTKTSTCISSVNCRTCSTRKKIQKQMQTRWNTVPENQVVTQAWLILKIARSLS